MTRQENPWTSGVWSWLVHLDGSATEAAQLLADNLQGLLSRVTRGEWLGCVYSEVVHPLP